MHSWTAKLVRQLNVDGYMLYVYRPVGEGRLECVTRLIEGGPPVTKEVGVYETHGGGLLLPWGAGEALIEQFTPQTSEGEIRRLEEALETERQRVDKVVSFYMSVAK